MCCRWAGGTCCGGCARGGLAGPGLRAALVSVGLSAVLGHGMAVCQAAPGAYTALTSSRAHAAHLPSAARRPAAAWDAEGRPMGPIAHSPLSWHLDRLAQPPSSAKQSHCLLVVSRATAVAPQATSRAAARLEQSAGAAAGRAGELGRRARWRAAVEHPVRWRSDGYRWAWCGEAVQGAPVGPVPRASAAMPPPPPLLFWEEPPLQAPADCLPHTLGSGPLCCARLRPCSAGHAAPHRLPPLACDPSSLPPHRRTCAPRVLPAGCGAHPLPRASPPRAAERAARLAAAPA